MSKERAIVEGQDVTLGSGKLYIKLWEGTMPNDEELEVEANRIGGIKGGASVNYKPTIYSVIDDDGIVHKVFITDSEVSLKSGILTWNLEVLNKISLCGNLTTTGGKRVLKLGNKGALNNYVVRFVHEKEDGLKIRVTIVGTCQNGFELVFDPSKETVIDAEFIGGTIDKEGTKLILEEELKTTPQG